MTIEELYKVIGGDYEQAIKVLRMDKLIDKHIRKLSQNEIFDNLLSAKDSLDPNALFDAAHAIKGVCANLGLVNLSKLASEIAEEFRNGSQRKMSDDEVKAKIDELEELYKRSVEGIKEYEASQN
jgi:HPt (histidine-containing phosphotransfer) domain-containing protein